MKIAVGELKGITADIRAKLKAHGLHDSDQFLAAVKTHQERMALSKTLGVAERDLVELANRADLARIKGVAAVFGNLLEDAGVDTVKELSKRVPANLHEKLVAVNAEKKVSGRTPTLAMVEDWVAQAKGLPVGLEY
jgi:predicted flap endonuclease-1-like 5' DNA nuclease